MIKSEFDRGVEIIHEVLHGLELFGCAYEDQEDVIYESLPEKDCPDERYKNLSQEQKVNTKEYQKKKKKSRIGSV